MTLLWEMQSHTDQFWSLWPAHRYTERDSDCGVWGAGCPPAVMALVHGTWALTHLIAVESGSKIRASQEQLWLWGLAVGRCGCPCAGKGEWGQLTCSCPAGGLWWWTLVPSLLRLLVSSGEQACWVHGNTRSASSTVHTVGVLTLKKSCGGLCGKGSWGFLQITALRTLCHLPCGWYTGLLPCHIFHLCLSSLSWYHQPSSLCEYSPFYTPLCYCNIFLFLSFVLLHIYTFLIGKGRKKGEKHWCEREISIGCLLNKAIMGTEPTEWACTLTENRGPNLLVCVVTQTISVTPGMVL